MINIFRTFRMKKLLIIAIICLASQVSLAQAKGTRIGFIDMEYILGKLPNYNEALNSLEKSAGDWKAEIDKKNADIKLLKDALNTERVLLTKDLIAEREEEIKFLEDELITYQQKKFGPEGDLIVMRSTLVKPVQDLVFSIVQDVANKRNYDFILDKSSDITVLFAKKNLDLSDYVVRAINRSLKGERISKKEQEKIDKEEEDLLKVKTPQQEEREKRLEEKREEIKRRNEERDAAREAKKAEAEARRSGKPAPKSNASAEEGVEEGETNAQRLKREAEERKAQKLQAAADRKKEAAEKRQQLIDERNKAKATPKETPKTNSGMDFENEDNGGKNKTPKTNSTDQSNQTEASSNEETPVERKRRENAERLEQRRLDIQKRKDEAKAKRDALIKDKENKSND
jgi:Skp family chaperone for outer membrane proteins